MRTSRPTADELIISETPGCLWIFGLFFALIGGFFVYGSLGRFTNHNEVPRWGIALSCVMGMIGVIVGIWVIYNAPVTKIIINRRAQTVIYDKYGLNGKTRTIYGFDQIKRFLTVEEKDSEGDSIWSFGMEFYGGKTIKFSALESHFENSKRDIVFETNQFMKKQIPFYKDGFNGELF